jgi:hypothetical protein
MRQTYQDHGPMPLGTLALARLSHDRSQKSMSPRGGRTELAPFSNGQTLTMVELLLKNILDYVIDTFHFTELIPSEQVDVHIEAFLHWRNLGIQSAD